MSYDLKKLRVSLALKALVPAVVLLGGCATTTVTGTTNPSGAQASAWSNYDSLPVELHGTVPGRTEGQLASLFPADPQPQYAAIGDLPLQPPGRRMVLYVNPARMPPNSALCSDSTVFQSGPQSGKSAYVEGALCDGPKLISTANGYVLAKDASPHRLAQNFGVIRDQLYQVLFPGRSDPDWYMVN
jgi:hypothetical protein